MALTSCSQDSDNSISIQAEPEDNSPVLIRLGSGAKANATRATIESEADGKFACDSLGIFMLAKNKTAFNPEIDAVTWSTSDAYGELTWLNNQWAKVNQTTGKVTFYDKTSGDEVSKYYPIDNWYAYLFYAYQPIRPDENVTLTESLCSVSFTDLDGTQDIICGQTADPSNDWAYCSRYFHQTEHKDETPNLALNHMQMRLQFYLVGIPDTVWNSEHTAYTLNYEGCNNMVLDSLYVMDVPTSAELKIAAIPATTPTLTYDWSGDKANYYLREEDDDQNHITPQRVDGELADDVNTDEGQPIGEPIMMPVYDGTYKLGMGFHLYDTPSQSFVIQSIDLNSNNAFEAGKTYKVKIRISGPSKVELEATLTDWDDDGGEAELILN